MLNTLIRMIRRANHPTGFQAYMNNIQSSGHGSAPTVQEARRDYREMAHLSHNLEA